MKIEALYVHIPFCLSKCHYCDFCSLPLSNVTKQQLCQYTKCLKQETDLLYEQVNLEKIKTIYFGGGTPTAIPVALLVEVMEHLMDRLNTDCIEEVTIEANPETLTLAKLKTLKGLGFNRLSIGAQAFNDDFLKRMGRNHDNGAIVEGLNLARKCGWDNINLDLIYGLPGQTVADWQKTLDRTLELEPEHIAAYGLMIDRQTKWGKELSEGKLSLPEEEQVYQMFVQTGDRLSKAGFEHYEVSNYSKKGYESKHNLAYWLNKYYLGLGLAAGSFYFGKRYYNQKELQPYLADTANGFRPVAEVINLSKAEEMSETMIMGLRLMKGLSLSDFYFRFGVYPQEVYKKEIKKLIDQNLLVLKNDLLRLTPRGIPLANLVFCEFV